MRQILFSLIVALAAIAGLGAVAAEQEPAVDIPEHGLVLLLETPDSPVGQFYRERHLLT